MNLELIHKREDGSKVKIIARCWMGGISDMMQYEIDVVRQPPGKRKFFDVVDTDDYSYRKLSLPDRQTERLRLQLQYVTREEMLEAKLKLWHMLKPE